MQIASDFSLLVVLALILGTSPAARAQNTSASIRGTVTMSKVPRSRSRCPDHQRDTGDSRSDKTDKTARTLPSIPIGRYTLNASGQGFKAFQLKISSFTSAIA